jgi:hypothetical protein
MSLRGAGICRKQEQWRKVLHWRGLEKACAQGRQMSQSRRVLFVCQASGKKGLCTGSLGALTPGYAVFFLEAAGV